MTVNAFIAFAAGAFVSFVISAAFAGAKFWELWEKLEESRDEVVELKALLTEARDNMPIREWDEQWVVPIRPVEVRERIYDKYENLVQPGSEVLDLTDAEDNDPMGHQDWTYE